MTQLAIVTDINRCVGCLACSVACKVINNVPIGSFWNKTLRIGPTPTEGGSGNWPDVEMYFLNVSCQHCEEPQCVEVCPTGASQKMEDGTVQIDKSKCIGCQFCVMACPYNVRYLNEEERVVEKCTLCTQRTTEGALPQCVSQCCGMARWYGDVEQGLDSFRGPNDMTLGEFVEDFDEADVHQLIDVGNKPSYRYILRKFRWRG
ncbi:MAG: 4Fe-4S dicluster domain-containing protein [Coriobacteriaceae bacterium]|jgi:Fe-S-cluster-containing dehydrogenase component|nr:4Fe-4S dicluster domain-containing protein [Coriobacteriaceae bacterium]